VQTQVECEIDLLKKASNHPNIVEFQGWYWDEAHVHCMVLGYCAGGSLDQVITPPRQPATSFFSEEQIMLCFVQLLAALNHLHSLKIVHRDIKPQNIFLSKCKKLIRLGDLGIAKELQSTDEFASTCLGTPYYMGPELMARQPYTLAADVLSLVCGPCPQVCCVGECTLVGIAPGARLTGFCSAIDGQGIKKLNYMVTLRLRAAAWRTRWRRAARPSTAAACRCCSSGSCATTLSRCRCTSPGRSSSS
jgi:serine/threonine protein kinase